MKLWLLKQFNYYWDAFFTWVDTKQLLIWYKLKTYERELEYEDVEELNNYLKEMENFKDWEDIK
jgi:hypothetical protein